MYRGPGARVGSKNLFVIITQLKPGKAHLPEGSLLIICPTLKRMILKGRRGLERASRMAEVWRKIFPLEL